MTENKRFTYFNTQGWQRGAFLEAMNGLDEKNRKLKERIKQHEEIISEQAIQLDYLQDENKQLIDVLNENEQLKSTNMEMEDYLGRLEERIKELKKENQELLLIIENQKGDDRND